MQRSTDRILTTHTGSLPRPDELTRTMFAKEEGVPVDAAALAAGIRSAVATVVRRQAEIGLDIINDGEFSKPSYATYVKDRLAGFEGASHPLQYRDLVDFPGMARRVFGDPGRARRKTPACTGPVALRDPEAARADVANLQAVFPQVRAREGFLTAASPGVISPWPPARAPCPSRAPTRATPTSGASSRRSRCRRASSSFPASSTPPPISSSTRP